MNKKRIIASAAIGTIALVALSISLTLAWYGASDYMRVENLEVNISTRGNLKASVYEDRGYKESLNDDDLNDLDEKFYFSPVSTMYKESWMSQKADKPVFYDSSEKAFLANGEPSKQATTFGVFQKEIYLLTTMRSQYATLEFDDEEAVVKTASEFKADSDSNSVRAQDLQRDYPEWNMTLSEIQERLDNLLKALRISILVNQDDFYRYYILDPTKQNGDVTYLGGLLDNDRNGYYDTYTDINGNRKEIVYGDVNNRELIKYDDPVDVNASTPIQTHEYNQYLANSFEAEHRLNAYTYNKTDSLNNEFEIAKEESLSPQDIRNDETKLLIPLTSGVPTKIILSIYLEGWDLDCINATMGASFIAKLVFKLRGGNV